MRRKVVHKPKAAGGDDKKLSAALKKLNVQPITGVEEVNMFREDGNVLHFASPKRASYILFHYFITGSTYNHIYMYSARCCKRQHIRDLRRRPGQGAHRAHAEHSQPAWSRFARISAQACRVLPVGPGTAGWCR